MSATPLATTARPPTIDGTSLLARAGWVVVTLLTVGLDFYAIPTLYHQAQTGCPDPGPCREGIQLLTVSQVAQLHAQGLTPQDVGTFTVVMDTVPMVVCVTLAALIFWRRSTDRMALFCAYMLVTFGGAVLGGAMGALLSANMGLFILVTTLIAAGQVSWVVFFCVFPDGRFTPGWTRWVALAWSLPWLASYFPTVAALSFTQALRNGPFLLIVVGPALVLAQVYRYRRVSHPRERRQTKWVVYSFALGIGVFAALLFYGNVVNNAGPRETALGQLTISGVFTALLLLIPIGISIAILRSRLYDIDIIIRRTLIYGSLTAILAGVYFTGVVGAQWVVSQMTGKAVGQQPVAIVLTTLALFALFQPLRHGLQRLIDQRFYRGKYDAERALASFGAALRGEVDLDHLSQRLTGVIEETMRPASLSLWLRPAERVDVARRQAMAPASQEEWTHDAANRDRAVSAPSS